MDAITTPRHCLEQDIRDTMQALRNRYENLPEEMRPYFLGQLYCLHTELSHDKLPLEDICDSLTRLAIKAYHAVDESKESIGSALIIGGVFLLRNTMTNEQMRQVFEDTLNSQDE